MSVIIKGDSALDMYIVSNIKDVQSSYIKFQNIYFKCKSIEDAGGAIFVKRKKGKWVVFPVNDSRGRRTGHHKIQCVHCGFSKQIWHSYKMPKYCEECGSYNGGDQEAARATGKDHGNAAADVLMPGC